MLPINVLQMDYQDFGNLVWDHLELIEKFEIDHGIKFHGVVAKLRNGTIPGSIVANHFNIPMGVLNAPRQTDFNDYEVFLPWELADEIGNKSLNILFVDGICGTGETLRQVTEFFANKYPKEINLYTYTTLVDVRAKLKPTIVGLEHNKFFQPPWEWRSFTPQTHLDRLFHSDIKASTESFYSVGFSSKECKSKFEQHIGQKFTGEWIEVFNIKEIDRKITSSSGVSSIEIPEHPITISLCKNKFAPLIDKKVEFIQSNGLTHYIEYDFSQAVVLSEKCPVCHVIYFDGDNLVKLYAKGVAREKITSLV